MIYPIVYLIRCVGNGDVQLTVIGPATWAWINSPRPAALETASSTWETIPKEALDEHTELVGSPLDVLSRRVQVTRGSCENDRALQCPGLSFYDEDELERWRTEHKVGFGGTYTGCIY